jgi:hypothetical protein
MNIGQREPLKERGGATNTEVTQSQASFDYGELPVVEQQKRAHLQEFIRSFLAVLSELKMDADECPEVVNLVQTRLTEGFFRMWIELGFLRKKTFCLGA